MTPTRGSRTTRPPTSRNAIVIAVVAPFVEELTFRGLGYSLLVPLRPLDRDHPRRPRLRRSRTASSRRSRSLPPSAPVLAYLRSRVDSVYPGMIVHGLFNATALTVAVAGKPSGEYAAARALGSGFCYRPSDVCARGGGCAAAVSIQATPATGAGAAARRLHRDGDARPYHWDFGDGTSADGATAEHTYAAGRWTDDADGHGPASGETATAQRGGHRLRPDAREADVARSATAAASTFRGRVRARRARRVSTLRGPGGGSIGHGAYDRRTARSSSAHGSGVPGDYIARSEPRSGGAVATRARRPEARHRARAAAARAAAATTFTARALPRSCRQVCASAIAPRQPACSSTARFRARVHIRLDTRRLGTYRIRVAVVPKRRVTPRWSRH